MYRFVLAVAGFAVGLFYRRFRYGGTVPAEGPLILVGNHPNGLVDPIVAARATSRPVRFLAKETLFRMPILGTFVRGMHALPVYRSVDGADTAQNERTFEAVSDALAAGEVVCLFPEGVSHSDPALRRLKTGAARMALRAEADAGFELGLRVLPIGLVYRDKRRFRSKMAVWIGEPIPVEDLREAYAEDAWKCVEALTARIAEGLRSVTLNTDRWEDLPLLELAERLWPERGDRRVERIQRLAEGFRRMREHAPEEAIAIQDRVAAFQEQVDRLGVPPNDLDRRYEPRKIALFVGRNLLALFLGLPVALAGALFWIVPYELVRFPVALLRPSSDVVATVKVLAALVLFPAWLGAATFLAARLGGSPAAFATLLAAPPAGMFAIRFLERRRAALTDAGTFFRLAFRRALTARLAAERDALAAELERLARRFPRASA